MNHTPYILRSDLQLMIEMEEFCIFYVALTGRSLRSAKRLVRRLNLVANASRSHSMHDLMKEWRRRYMEGWAYSRYRRGIQIGAR